jgi:hypothetical protein
MAEHREHRRENGPGAPGGEDLRDWTHTHGAGGRDPDPEVSVRGVLWTAGGIALVTAVAMVLMVWLLGGLREVRTAAEPPPTPAEVQRREALRRAAQEGRADQPVPLPSLALPPGYELPPAPRLELDPDFNLRQLRAVEDRLLGEWAWADEEAGAVRIPIDVAIELAAAGRLPGVPRGGSRPQEESPQEESPQEESPQEESK